MIASRRSVLVLCLLFVVSACNFISEADRAARIDADGDGLDWLTDCDGEVDEDDAIDVLTWYADSDGDGHGWGDSSYGQLGFDSWSPQRVVYPE